MINSSCQDQAYKECGQTPSTQPRKHHCSRIHRKGFVCLFNLSKTNFISFQGIET